MNNEALSNVKDLGVSTGARDRAGVSTDVSTNVRTDWWRDNTSVPSNAKQIDDSINMKNKKNGSDCNTNNFNCYKFIHNDTHDVREVIPSFSLAHKNTNNRKQDYSETCKPEYSDIRNPEYSDKTDRFSYHIPFETKDSNINYQYNSNSNNHGKNQIKSKGLLSFAY
jgi:hypothetical protein